MRFLAPFHCAVVGPYLLLSSNLCFFLGIMSEFYGGLVKEGSSRLQYKSLSAPASHTGHNLKVKSIFLVIAPVFHQNFYC